MHFTTLLSLFKTGYSDPARRLHKTEKIHLQDAESLEMKGGKKSRKDDSPKKDHKIRQQTEVRPFKFGEKSRQCPLKSNLP